MFSQTDLKANAVSMAFKLYIKDGTRTVGCAFVDVQEKTIGVAEFVDDENFGNTEVGHLILTRIWFTMPLLIPSCSP